jgi:hypothetical protein
MDSQWLRDDGSRPHARIQGGERVLKHELQVPPYRPQASLRHRRDIGAVEFDAPTGRVRKTQDQAGDRRFPASRLANESKRFAGSDVEGHSVDSARAMLRIPIRSS